MKITYVYDAVYPYVKGGVFLHGVCEPKELYVDGRRTIKEAIYLL